MLLTALVSMCGTALALEEDAQQLGRHRPGDAGHLHAHPDIDIVHPVIGESPVPETHVTLRYEFAESDAQNDHNIEAGIQYAFTRSFSIELAAPMAVIDREAGPTLAGIGNLEISGKWATYSAVQHGLLPAFGVAVSLPTGNEERGIGSDHVVELQPFAMVGFVLGKFDFIAGLDVSIPLNQSAEEHDAENFAVGYHLSVAYRALPTMQGLLELWGSSTFGEDDETAFYVAPALAFQPFKQSAVNLGIGFSLPVTEVRDFDYAVNLMAILHL